MADSPVIRIHLQCLWAGMHPVVMRTQFFCCFLGCRIRNLIRGQSGWWAITWSHRTQETVPDRCRPTSSLWPTDPRLNRKRSSNLSWSIQDQCPEAAILGCVREGSSLNLQRGTNDNIQQVLPRRTNQPRARLFETPFVDMTRHDYAFLTLWVSSFSICRTFPVDL